MMGEAGDGGGGGGGEEGDSVARMEKEWGGSHEVTKSQVSNYDY